MTQYVVPMPNSLMPATERFACGFCGCDVYQVPEIRNLTDHPDAKNMRFVFVCPACESDALIHPEKYLGVKGFNFLDLSRFSDERAGQILRELTEQARTDPK